MTEWQKAAFTEVIDFQEGPGILAKDFRDCGVPLVRLSGLDEGASVLNGCNYLDPGMVDRKWAHFALAEGDILLSTSASLGRVVTVQSEGAGAIAYTGIVRMRPRDQRIFAPFIRYLLASPEFQQQAAAAGAGSVLKHFGPMHFQHMYVHLPLVAEQQKITAVLSALDAKIDLNNRINRDLEALAKTIYDYWFVQFDFPFDFAKGRSDAHGRPYKSSGGAMVWNDTLKREIPAGWEAGSLDDLGQIVGGGTPSTTNPDHFGRDMIPWITPKDLSNNKGNKFIARGATDVSEAGIRSASLTLYPAGTVLMSSRAPVGYLAIALNPMTTNQGFKSFVPSKGYGTSFVYYAVQCALPTIIQYASGSTFVEISGGVLKSVHAVLPDKVIAEAFCRKIESIIERQRVAELENIALTRLRDWLLPLLMNGQVCVTGRSGRETDRQE